MGWEVIYYYFFFFYIFFLNLLFYQFIQANNTKINHIIIKLDKLFVYMYSVYMHSTNVYIHVYCISLSIIPLAGNILGFHDKTFVEFLKAKKLTETIRHYVQHAIAMVTNTATTLEVCHYD